MNKEYKVSLNYTFELTEKELELLKHINEIGYAEYRDFTYYDFEGFKNGLHYKNNFNKWDDERWLEYFNNRNTNGSMKEACSLYEYGLIKDVQDSWHSTFEISELGKQLLEQNNI